MLNTFRGMLSIFQDYVKSFQSEKPRIHILHSKMVEVVQRLMGIFVKPEHIPDSASKLKNLNVTHKSIQKSDKDLSVGKYAYCMLT